MELQHINSQVVMMAFVSAIRLGVVPALLAIGVLTSFGAAGRVAPGVRVTAYCGFWAGVILSAMTVLLGNAIGVHQTAEPSGANSALTGVLGGLVGLVVGFGAPILFAVTRTSRLVGCVLLILTWGSSAALINYAIWPASRPFTIGLALVTALCSCGVFVVPRDVSKTLPGRLAQWADKRFGFARRRWDKWKQEGDVQPGGVQTGEDQ